MGLICFMYHSIVNQVRGINVCNFDSDSIRAMSEQGAGDAAVGGPSNIISTNNLVNAYDGGNANEAAVQGLMCSRSLPQLRTMTSTIHVRGQSRQTAEDHSGHQGGNADKATAQVLTCSRSLTPELRMGTSTIHVRRQRRMSTEVYSTDFVYVKPMPDRVGHVNNGDGTDQDNELDNDDINISLLDAYIELV
jgi:hypothetical protein